jgi:spore germination protein (amino acid permease)
MDQKQMIGQRQLAWLISSIMMTQALMNLPRETSLIAGINAWFCYIVPVAFSFLYIYGVYRLMRLFPGKNLYEINLELAGPVFGRIINLIVLLYFWLILMRDVRWVSFFTKTVLLQQTPEEIIILVFMFVVLYYARSSLEVTVRVNDLFFPAVLLLMLFLPILLVNEFNFRLNDPILTDGLFPILVANVLNTGWYADLLVIGAFLPMVSGARSFLTSTRHGVVLSTFLLTLLTWINVYVLGPPITSRAIFPSYLLIQQIHLTDFLDRLEILIYSFWAPMIIIKVIAFTAAIMIGINSFTGETDHRLMIRPFIWIATLTTILSFRTFTEVYNFANFSIPAIFFVWAVPVLILLQLLSLRPKFAAQRRRASEKEQEQHEERMNDPNEKHESSEGGGQNGPFFQKVNRLPYRIWKHWTHRLIALGALLIIAGGLFGRYLPAAGTAAGILYAVCILLVVWTSYMEMRRTNQPPESGQT